MDGGNPLWRFHRLPQRFAQLAHAGLEHPIAHRRLGPHGVEDRFFGHQLPGMRHHIGQEVKGFRPERHWLLGAPQAGIGQIEPEGSKVPLHRLSLHYRPPL
jgi:hypothetical protein